MAGRSLKKVKITYSITITEFLGEIEAILLWSYDILWLSMLQLEKDTLTTPSQQGLTEVTQFFSAHKYRCSLSNRRIDFVLPTSTEHLFPRLHCFLPLDQSYAPIFGQMGIHLDKRPHTGDHFTTSSQELVSQEIMRLKNSLQDPTSVPLRYSQLLIDRLSHLALFGAGETIAELNNRPYKPEMRDSKHQKYNRKKDMRMGSVYTWEVD